MKVRDNFRALPMLLAIGLVAVGNTSAVQSAGWGCLPTCDTTDGRFLAIIGSSYETLSGSTIELRFSVPGSETEWTLGFFDGDTGGLWDQGSHAPGAFQYRLYADPNGDGTGTLLIRQWSSDELTDNAWDDFELPLNNEARSASGSYFYRMVVEDTDPSTEARDSFKIRSSNYVGIAPEAFSYIAYGRTINELRILYKGQTWPPSDLSQTTFDGTFDFGFFVPPGQSLTSLDIWDGDMDFGSYTGSPEEQDTDDPDTPDDVLPSWSTPGTAYEGVAVGTEYNGEDITGNPMDDNWNAIFRRSPSIEYEVFDANSNMYENANPSGNKEWERFRLTTDPSIPHDYLVSDIPAGFYNIHVFGADIFNLNAWVLPYEVVCVREDGSACIPLRPDACSRTQGYWKQDQKPWPVQSIEIGGHLYTRDEAQAVMAASGSGDKRYDLFQQLVASKLNVLSGNDYQCVADDIAAADQWFTQFPKADEWTGKVKASSATWKEIAESHDALDDYNNGLTVCADHCD